MASRDSPEGSPRVWVIIVNWNGRELLTKCLESLRVMEDPPFHVLVVDNGSTDGSAETLRKSFPWVEVLALDRNMGFSGGNNLAMKEAFTAGAEFLLLLNNDIVVEDSMFLVKLLAIMEGEPSTAAVGPKVMDLQERTLQQMGLTIDPLGFPKPDPRAPGEVFYASGCALLLRASALQAVGPFADFFFSVEDLELCWRFHLAGFRVLATDATSVLHAGGASLQGGYPGPGPYTTSRERLYLRELNTLRTLLRCYALPSLIMALALYLPLALLELFIFAVTLRGAACWEYARAYGWILGNLRTVLRERREVQGLRRVPERTILQFLSPAPGKAEVLLRVGLPRLQGRGRGRALGEGERRG